MNYPQLAAKAAAETAHLSALDAVKIDVSSADHELGRNTRWVWVGGLGDLKVGMASGQSVTLVNVPDGTMLPLAINKVYRTGTDANEVIALF